MSTTTRRMNLYTVDCDILFGRKWITQFAKEINFVDLFSNEIHALLLHNAYLRIRKNKQINYCSLNKDVFSDVIGTLKGPSVTVHLKSGKSSIFVRVCVKYHQHYMMLVRKKLKPKFHRDFIKVQHSEQASFTYVVVKKNGKLHITENY